jgi:hypothetical protein
MEECFKQMRKKVETQYGVRELVRTNPLLPEPRLGGSDDWPGERRTRSPAGVSVRSESFRWKCI